MATKTSKVPPIGEQIKGILRRNQRWLADQIGLSEPDLSNKLNGRATFTQEELDAINLLLRTNFKL